MKVYVDDMPEKPGECLFNIELLKRDNTKKNGLVFHYGCSMNNKTCDLEKIGKCDKLKCLLGEEWG